MSKLVWKLEEVTPQDYRYRTHDTPEEDRQRALARLRADMRFAKQLQNPDFVERFLEET